MIEEDTGVRVVQRPCESSNYTTANAGEVLINVVLFPLSIARASAACDSALGAEYRRHFCTRFA
jgi:hypothetical protein